MGAIERLEGVMFAWAGIGGWRCPRSGLSLLVCGLGVMAIAEALAACLWYRGWLGMGLVGQSVVFGTVKWLP